MDGTAQLGGMRLSGSSALVTGGSRGLGAALSRELARRGARVVLLARGRAALDSVVAEIRRAGGLAHALVEDVGDPEAASRIAGAAAALVGPLDLLVHNASELGPTPLRELSETTGPHLQRVLEVNLLGPFRLTRAVVGSMLLRGSGLVLAVSSDAAVVPYPGWGAYGASKAALDQLMRIWDAELNGSGVRFLSVDPGEMDTEMHAAAMPDADRATLRSTQAVARALADLLEGEPGARPVRSELWA
jgi:NAD(P)-dependent dehydrogenase (short-subunit alcohol dehydrogenase family)